MSSYENKSFQPTYTDLGLDSTGARLLQSPDGKIMKAYEWHRTQLTVDLIVIDISTGCIGLIKRKLPPYQNTFALPGGFVDLRDGEDVDSAVMREAKEEINFTNGTLSRATFRANSHRDPRGYTATCVYVVRVTSRDGYKAGDDAADLFWIPINDILTLTEESTKTFAPFEDDNVCGFAFDHFNILHELLNRDSCE